MVKKTEPKVFKFTRKQIGDSKDFLAVKFKNFDNKKIKELRTYLNDCVVHFMKKDDEEEKVDEY